MSKDGITLTTIRHPRGKPALGDLNPESLETVEIDLPEPVAWGVFDGPSLHDMFFTEEEALEMVWLKGDGSMVKPLYTSPPAQRIAELEALLERQTARIVDLQTHIDNFDGEDR